MMLSFYRCRWCGSVFFVELYPGRMPPPTRPHRCDGDDDPLKRTGVAEFVGTRLGRDTEKGGPSPDIHAPFTVIKGGAGNKEEPCDEPTETS